MTLPSPYSQCATSITAQRHRETDRRRSEPAGRVGKNQPVYPFVSFGVSLLKYTSISRAEQCNYQAVTARCSAVSSASSCNNIWHCCVGSCFDLFCRLVDVVFFALYCTCVVGGELNCNTCRSLQLCPFSHTLCNRKP